MKPRDEKTAYVTSRDRHGARFSNIPQHCSSKGSRFPKFVVLRSPIYNVGPTSEGHPRGPPQRATSEGHPKGATSEGHLRGPPQRATPEVPPKRATSEGHLRGLMAPATAHKPTAGRRRNRLTLLRFISAVLAQYVI